MAQREVESVLAAFQHGIETIRQGQQFQREQALREKQEQAAEEARTTAEQNLKEYRDSEVAHNKAVLEAQTAQNKAVNAATERLYNLQKLPITQQISEQYGKTGALPAGASITPDFIQNLPLPQIQGGPLGQIPQPQQPTSFQTGTIQLPGDLGVIPGALSPEAVAQRERILRAPEEEAKRREQEAQIEAQGRKQLEIALAEHGYRTSEIAQQLQGNKELEGMRAASALAVAKEKNGLLGDISDYPAATDLLNRIKMGKSSQEDVNRSPYKKQISALALNNGYQILPKADTDQIGAMETMGNILPKIRRMINLRTQDPVGVMNPFSENGKEYNALIKEIRAAGPQASVALSGVRRFSNPELNRFDEFFIPDRGFTSSVQANLSKYNAFKALLDQSIQKVTKGLTNQDQINAIISNLRSQGLTYQQLQLPPEQPKPSGLQMWRQNPDTGVLEIVPAQLGKQ